MAHTTHPEFMGLGAAIEITDTENASVSVEGDDGDTVVLRWPNGPTLYLNIRYAGVRVWLEVMADRLQEAGNQALYDAIVDAQGSVTRFH